MWLALFRGNVRVCILSNAGVDSKYALELGISNVTAILSRKCTAWLKANQ